MWKLIEMLLCIAGSKYSIYAVWFSGHNAKQYLLTKKPPWLTSRVNVYDFKLSWRMSLVDKIRPCLLLCWWKTPKTPKSIQTSTIAFQIISLPIFQPQCVKLLCSHHGQIAEMLTDLAASLWGLQCQPFPAGLLASLSGPQAAVEGAIAGRGVQTCLVEFMPLAHLYVPFGQERCSLSYIKLDVFLLLWEKYGGKKK